MSIEHFSSIPSTPQARKASELEELGRIDTDIALDFSSILHVGSNARIGKEINLVPKSSAQLGEIDSESDIETNLDIESAKSSAEEQADLGSVVESRVNDVDIGAKAALNDIGDVTANLVAQTEPKTLPIGLSSPLHETALLSRSIPNLLNLAGPRSGDASFMQRNSQVIDKAIAQSPVGISKLQADLQSVERKENISAHSLLDVKSEESRKSAPRQIQDQNLARQASVGHAGKLESTIVNQGTEAFKLTAPDNGSAKPRSEGKSISGDIPVEIPLASANVGKAERAIGELHQISENRRSVKDGFAISQPDAPRQQVVAGALAQNGPIVATGQNSELGDKAAMLEGLDIFPAGGVSLVRNDVTTGLAGATPAAPVAEQNTARSIAHQLLATMAVNDSGRSEISLSPKELGHLRMQIVVQDTSINMNILAERQETTDLMRRHIDTLTAEFQELGFTSITFSFNGERQSGDAEPDEPRLSGDAEQELDIHETQKSTQLSSDASLDLRL